VDAFLRVIDQQAPVIPAQ
jgi:hypothetical protein